MTPAEQVADLFGRLSVPDHGISWLAEQLIGAAVEQSVVVIEAVPVPGPERLLYALGHPPVHIGGRRISLFRGLLARFGVIGREETGADVNLYGDRYKFTRPSASGPVEVFVEFHNTPGMQRLQIVTQPAAPPAGANGTHPLKPAAG